MTTPRMIRVTMTCALFVALASGQIACRKNNVPDPQPTQPRPGDGGGGGGTAADTPPAPQTKSVVIYNSRFNPNSLSIPVGSKVVFRNKDPEQHNVSVKKLNIDQMLKSNESLEVVFGRAGTYTVSNRLANTPMKATITVR